MSIALVISVLSNLPEKTSFNIITKVLVIYPDIFEVLIAILTCAVFAWAWIWMNLRVSFVESGGNGSAVEGSKQEKKKKRN